MTLKFEFNKVRNVIIFALLLFAAMNFQAKFFYFVFGATVVQFVFQRYLIADWATLVYVALCGWMAFYNSDEGILSMIRCLAPLCFYLVGMNIVTDNNKSSCSKSDLCSFQSQAYMLLFMIALGSFAHYIMNFVYNYDNDVGRNTFDIWTGAPMAATVQNALACLMMGFAIAMFYLPKKKWHSVVSVIIIVLILAYNLVLASRTLFVIMFILFLVGFIYKLANKLTLDGKNKGLLLGVLCLFVVVLMLALNVGGVRDKIANSLLFERFSLSSLSGLFNDGARTNAKFSFIKEGYKYPMGGLHLRAKYGFAHDLLLDGYDEYGVIGFLLMVGMLVSGITGLFKTLRYTSYSHEFKLTLLLMYVAILLEFCVEPIIEGMPWLFSCFSLVSGCISGLNRSYFKKGADQ